MTRRIITAPASDRPLVRRFAQRLDQILGFPRTLAESEVTRTGPASQSAPLPRIETAFAAHVRDATGAVILHGAIALEVDGRAVELANRFVEHAATRKRVSEWVADQGWQIRGDLPGDPEAWTALEPRDGAAGSADGTPIPEGSE
jgi:hypothetical protein